MTLTDTGPLVALIDQEEQPRHQMCLAALPKLRGPMITTVACFTETLYFLGDRGGLALQRMLWRYVDTGRLQILAQQEPEIRRMRELMERYHDSPMSFPDASLVVAAETLGVTRIFTFDSHFYGYRINDKTPFEVIP